LSEIADKIQRHIIIDDSGKDTDTLEIRSDDEGSKRVAFSMRLYERIDAGTVTLPDGTHFDRDELQLGFQQALIAKTGMCVLEHEYIQAGYPDLAKLAKSARS
jgi:hypothetical protein